MARSLVDAGKPAPRGIDPATSTVPATCSAADGGDGVVVVVGRPSLAESGDLVADAAQALAASLPGARFLPALRRGNVLGALDMGLAPGLLPGRVTLEAGREWFTEAWGSVPAARGRDTAAMLACGGPGRRRPGPGPPRLGPAARLPRCPAGPEGAGRGRVRGGRGLDPGGGHRARRRGASGGGGPRAARDDDEHRGPGEQPRAEARGPGAGLGRLDDRRRAGRAPRRRPGPRLGGRRLGRDRAAGSRLPGHHPGRARRGRWRGRRGRPAASTPVRLRNRAVAPLDPIAVPGVESVERQGAPPRAGFAETPSRRGRGPAAGAAGGARRRPDAPRSSPGRSTSRCPRCAQGDSYSPAWWPGAGSTTAAPRSVRRRRWPAWSPPVSLRIQPPGPRRPRHRRGGERAGPDGDGLGRAHRRRPTRGSPVRGGHRLQRAAGRGHAWPT